MLLGGWVFNRNIPKQWVAGFKHNEHRDKEDRSNCCKHDNLSCRKVECDYRHCGMEKFKFLKSSIKIK